MNWLAYRGDRLHAEDVDLEALAERHGTPLYVYSRRAIVDAYREFARAASGDTTICYALKANPNLAIVDLLAREGAGFDIVSVGELRRVIAAGGTAAKVVFSGVGKRADEMGEALAAGVRCFNVESVPELERLDAVARAAGLRAPVSLRVNPDVDARTHPYISTGLRENKFGIAFEQAFDAYRRAHALPGIAVVGIDCHIGSQITELAPFLAALDRVLDLYDRLRECGIPIAHLDLGGGLGIRYHDESPPAPAEMVAAIEQRLARRIDRSRVSLMFEFGRAIVGNAGLLLARVEYLKPTPARSFAIVDAAMNDLLRPALYDAYHGVLAVRRRDGPVRHWDFVGPVCESGDWLARDRGLCIEAGDLVGFASAGAYGMSMSSNYNSRPRAAEVMVDRERVHVVRERETIDSLYALERRLPDAL